MSMAATGCRPAHRAAAPTTRRRLIATTARKDGQATGTTNSLSATCACRRPNRRSGSMRFASNRPQLVVGPRAHLRQQPTDRWPDRRSRQRDAEDVSDQAAPELHGLGLDEERDKEAQNDAGRCGGHHRPPGSDRPPRRIERASVRACDLSQPLRRRRRRGQGHWRSVRGWRASADGRLAAPRWLLPGRAPRSRPLL